MQGARVILDERHAARQHRVFALFVVVGLLTVLAVWYIQVRMAMQRGAISEVQGSIQHISDTWNENLEMVQSQSAAPHDDTQVEDAVQKVMREWEVKEAIGSKMTEALQQ